VHASFVQALPSSQGCHAPGLQAPPAHRSPTVQISWSSHASVFGVNVHPFSGSHESVVQGFPSSQAGAPGPGAHAPSLQKSPSVHRLPSSQAAWFGVKAQPVDGTHTSSVHGLASSHVMERCRQTPAALSQRSTVQAFRSSQSVSMLQGTHPARGVKVQPVFGSQESTVHGSPSLHETPMPPWQRPPPQASPAVQASPSSQERVWATFEQRRVAGLQWSSVQSFPSSQSPSSEHGLHPGIGSATQHRATESQRSAVQGSPSSHPESALQAPASTAWMQPLTASQESRVQARPSSQGVGPKVHRPVATSHTSTVHALPSAQSASVAHRTQDWTCWQPKDGLHESSVQSSRSSQGFAPWVQTDRTGEQLSIVHGLPSSHSVSEAQEPHPPIFAWEQAPVDESQESIVQSSWSSHSTGVGTQAVSEHRPGRPFVVSQVAGRQRSPVKQSASFAHVAVQPQVDWQVPESRHLSRVQALPSSQAASEPHARQSAIFWWEQTPVRTSH